jgi:hypothetical protein
MVEAPHASNVWSSDTRRNTRTATRTARALMERARTCHAITVHVQATISCTALDTCIGYCWVATWCPQSHFPLRDTQKTGVDGMCHCNRAQVKMPPRAQTESFQVTISCTASYQCVLHPMVDALWHHLSNSLRETQKTRAF